MLTAAGKLLGSAGIRLLARLVFSVGLANAQVLPPGLFRGVLQHTGSADRPFELKTISGSLLAFRFDSKTWIERDGRRVTGDQLQSGEKLEVICDREDVPVHYARIIHSVTESKPPVHSVVFATVKPAAPHPPPSLAPVTFSGSVVRIDSQSMDVRIRASGISRVWLTDDTRYFLGGDEVGIRRLTPNTLIFLSAGWNREGELEALSVSWGSILFPPGF